MTSDAANKNLGEVNIFKLGETLQKGDIVGVKISPESEWISDVVERIDSQTFTIEVKLLEEFINQDIMVDDVVEFQLMKGSIEYILKGRVEDIGIIHPQSMIVEILSIEKYINSRRSKRYTVNLCGRMIYNDNESSAFVTVKNISETGISLICKDHIEVDEEVDVDVVLWKQEVLSVEGKIVRAYKSGRNYKYGVLIEYISTKSKGLLRDFISEMEKSEKELAK